MNIDEIFSNFSERLSEINVYQRSARDVADIELKKLSSYAEKIKENPDFKDMGFSVNWMYFHDARTGKYTKYGSRKSSIEDRIKLAIFQKNKQYCWLLAEAYEEFEDFIESAYAYIGYKNNKVWLLNDFGKITFSELEDKDYDWYLEQSKKISGILSRLRNLYPDFVNIEANNKLNLNLKVAIELIENLRHIVVHKSGVVRSRDAFLESILKKSGVWNNGKYEVKYKDFIEVFFGVDEYKNIIFLLEYPDLENPFISHNRYEQLTGYLMTYARLIFENIKNT